MERLSRLVFSTGALWVLLAFLLVCTVAVWREAETMPTYMELTFCHPPKGETLCLYPQARYA